MKHIYLVYHPCKGSIYGVGTYIKNILSLIKEKQFTFHIVLLNANAQEVTTQTINGKELIFEAVSAIGTVGLSMGITQNLDEVGKTIIVSAMFLGRTLPATLICYLNGKSYQSKLIYPDAKISLT